jgi:hypothetical protein
LKLIDKIPTMPGETLFQFMQGKSGAPPQHVAWGEFSLLTASIGWDQNAASQMWGTFDADKSGLLDQNEFMTFANNPGVAPYISKMEATMVPVATQPPVYDAPAVAAAAPVEAQRVGQATELGPKLKYTNDKVYQDKAWIMAYGANLVVLVGVMFYCGSKLMNDGGVEAYINKFYPVTDDGTDQDGARRLLGHEEGERAENTEQVINSLWFGLFAGTAIAISLSLGWIKFVKEQAENIPVFAFGTGAILTALNVFLYMQNIDVFVLIFTIVFAVIWCCYALFWCVRSLCYKKGRIPFAKAILKGSTHAIDNICPYAMLSMLISLMQLVMFMMYWFAVVSFDYVNTDMKCDESGVCKRDQGVMFDIWTTLASISWVWTMQIGIWINFCTVVGSVAAFWMVPDAQKRMTNSFKRAVTTSLGSIVLGALFIAVIRTMRQKLNQWLKSPFLACIVDIITAMLEYLTSFAFCYVAIYGKPMVESGKSAWGLFKGRSGWDVLLHDSAADTLLVLGLFAVAHMGGTIGIVFATMGSMHVGMVLICSCVMAFVVCSMFNGILTAAVRTTIVVWCESPEVLAKAQPEVAEEIIAKAEILWPTVNFREGRAV